MTSQDHVTLSKLTGTGMTVKNATDDMRGAEGNGQGRKGRR
jgi:hypothetical protein